MVNRKYCIRGNKWRKGEVETIDTWGRSNYRTVKDKKYAFRDGPIFLCFNKKERDIKENTEPCFDEGRMWCIPNDCSVFECNKLWWGKRKKKIIEDIDIYLRNKDKLLKICFEMTNIESDEDFIFKLNDLHKLKHLLPWGRVYEDFEYDRLIEEGYIKDDIND